MLFIVGFISAVMTAALVYYLYYLEQREKLLFQDSSTKIKRECLKIKEKTKKMNSLNTQLDYDLLQIASLYEVTKDMGTALEFSEIFTILSGVIRRTFDFKKSKLILIAEVENHGLIEKIYEIQKGDPIQEEISFKERRKATMLDKELRARPTEVDVGGFDQNVVRLLLKTRKPIFVSPGRAYSSDIKLALPHEIRSFIAVPLIVENKIIAILTLEGFKGDVFDKFLILAGQLALEMKKIELYEVVQELSIMDGLTKAYVRRHFLEMYNAEMERSLRHKFKLSFFMIDIDYFKAYNDRYGHLSGDTALQEITEILKNSLRRVDLVGRYGGEEFAVILPQTDKKGAVQVAERIRWAADNHIFRTYYGEQARLSISIGVACFPGDAKKAKTLIEKADQALYRAKNKGRNRVEIYER
ncbi:MAG: sensor domain-containing diguanylate cyclase [Candidatus Omnitrophota bacterium]|nr:sensor domain-containing diguanylate cyclase [Candidatus Omnitrophota bacterium]